MPLQAMRNISDELGFFDKIASLAFFSSLPLILPCLDALHRLIGASLSQGSVPVMENTTFAWTMLIAVMFTALTMLFICLLKTSYGRLGKTLIRFGGIAYIAGYLILLIAGWSPGLPQIMLAATGLPLGFGSTIICMAWFSRVRLGDFRTAFVALLAVLVAASFVTLIALLLPSGFGISLLFALACLGSAEQVLGSRRHRLKRHSAASPGSNWWDVFGTFDISLVEGVDDFRTPASRILFFVITPLAMLLLFTVNRNTAAVQIEPYVVTLLGCFLTVICAIPLLFIKSDHGLIHMSYSLYLPLMAFFVFALNSFVSENIDGVVMSIGVDVFCILYFLLIASMIIAMAGRMRSLALPAISILLVALSLVALLSFSKVNAGALAAYQHYALMTLFVLAVAMLLATPGSRMWRMMLEGVSQSADQTAMTSSFLERCEALAKEYNLTGREAEILTYLGRGHSGSYVAEVLVVAESTVRSHRKNIYRKLGIGSREELLELINESPDDFEHEAKSPE